MNESTYRQLEFVPYADLKKDFDSFPIFFVLDPKFTHLNQNTLLEQIRVIHIGNNTLELFWWYSTLLSVWNVKFGQIFCWTKQECGFWQKEAFLYVTALINHFDVLFPCFFVVRLSVACKFQEHQTFTHHFLFFHFQTQSNKILDWFWNMVKWVILQFNCCKVCFGAFNKIFL